MGRIHIDTEALHDLSSQLGNDARELGGLNLDLVRAWSHALPPPVQLATIGAESARVQARLGGQVGEIALGAVRLDVYATGVEAHEGGRRLFGDLAAWSGQIRSKAGSSWRHFVAWGSAAVGSVATGAVRAIARALGVVGKLERVTDVVHRIAVVQVIGIASLAWTTIRNDPAVKTGERTDLAGKPSDLVAIGGSLKADEIAIVQLAPNRYVVVLRGVVPDVPSMYNSVAVAGIEEMAHWGPYSDAVLRAIQQAGLPAGAQISFVGHSEGGIVALNVSDRLASLGYQAGPVLTIGSPVIGEASLHPKLLAVVNDPYGPTVDPVAGLDHDIVVAAITHRDLPDNVLMVHEPGGVLPHSSQFYEQAVADLQSSSSPAAQRYMTDMHFESGQQANVTVYKLGP